MNLSSLTKISRELLFLIPILGIACEFVQAEELPQTPEPRTLEKLMEEFGWNFETSEITIQSIDDSLHVLFGIGGNIAVSIGADGVLIVDYQFPQMIPKVQAAIKKLGGKGVDFVINTHWHFDHAEGNLSLGPSGSWLVSQANSRRMMQHDHIINLVGTAYGQKAYPASAYPDITYDDTMHFHLNGGQIDLLHFGEAHTTGDTAVIFRKNNAVHLGDVYNNSGYPFIDADNGGSLNGVIKFCESTLAEINESTVVIPGHGAISDYQGLKDYIDMLKTVRERMVKMMDDGAMLQEIVAAGITREWDEKQGDPSGFLNRSYVSLKRVR